MKLYFNPLSPNVRRVRLTAAVLGLELDEKKVDFAKGEHKSPEYLALNVPQVEAGDVELDAGAVGAGALAQPLHQDLRFCHNLAAAVARLPAARTTPHPGNVVLGKPSIGQLCSNQEAKGGAYSSWSTSQRPGIRHARFTRVSAPSGVSRRPGCRQPHTAGAAGPSQV